MSGDGFRLPNSTPEKIDKIINRSYDFIDSGIWSGITLERLDTWFHSFKTDEEKYLAVKILESLVYRSEEQTIALAKQLFQRVLPDLLIGTPYDKHRAEWLDIFGDREFDATSRCQYRLVPIIRTNDPPTKSGPALARLYKRQLQFNEHLMIWPWQIGEEIEQGQKLFLFIDDFLGTGKQFVKFYKKYAISKYGSDIEFVYLPLAAHEKGVSKVRELCKNIKIGTAELLVDKTNNFFNGFDDTNSDAAAKDFYIKTSNKYLGLSSDSTLGYGKLSVTYAFEHATPNASVPLLWGNGKSFKCLLRR